MGNDQKKSKEVFYSPYDAVALKNILEHNKNITAEDVKQFFPVYYPVACIEISMTERDFEDFDFVNMTVLNMLALKITNISIISDTLGLSETYIKNVIKILSGYGYIDKFMGITQIGMDSMESQKKISVHSSAQKFQVDALNGRILKVEETMLEKNLKKPSKTPIGIPHIDYRGASVEESEIETIIQKNPQMYLQERGHYLNINVDRIDDIKLLSVDYCKAYMMKLQSCAPVVFYMAKGNNRFSVWKSFAVDPGFAEKYSVEEEPAVNSRMAAERISQVYESKIIKAHEITTDKILELCDFDIENIRAFVDRATDKLILHINSDSFRTLSRTAFDMISYLSEEGTGFFICHNLNGRVIEIKTEDDKLIELAKQLKKYGKKISKSKHIEKNSGCRNPIEKIKEAISAAEESD